MNILAVNPVVKKEILDYHEIIWWKHRDQFFNKKFAIELNRALSTRVNILIAA